MLAQDIDVIQERLVESMARGWRIYQGARGDAERNQNADRRQQAETTWRRAQSAYKEQAAKLNREILRYNLKVPSGMPQRALFEVDRELARLHDGKSSRD
jgi:hypothetical protein